MMKFHIERGRRGYDAKMEMSTLSSDGELQRSYH